MAFSDVKKFFLSWRMYLLAVLVLAAVVALLWGVPPLLVEQAMGSLDKPDAYHLANLEDAYRRTLAQILGGLALLYGLHLTQRRVVATEEGQVTERFTRAIDQLGDDKMAIRLGGIYALERLAKDSEKDYGSIMEVLTAYVREIAPVQTNYTPKKDEKPPTDIQAILTVIGRRETTGRDRGNILLDLDLADTQLIGADLRKADLRKADLRGIDLRKADLNKADLNKAALDEADLRGAALDKAKLRGADLDEADLRGADLNEADLRKAKNLTTNQVRSTKNWRKAHLPAHLEYLKATPEPSA